jgi:uncharacterized glyoxalase superfamily protein PhnB
VGRARPAGTPQIIPYLYYPDATLALEFLVDAFGFEVSHAVRDAEGVVWTAQLRLGDGVVMIGPGIEASGHMPSTTPTGRRRACIPTSRTSTRTLDVLQQHTRSLSEARGWPTQVA